MAKVKCSVRALKHNIRTINKKINQDVIPVVKCRALQHGSRILKEIARSYRYQPLFVFDKADADYIKAHGIENKIIQQTWDGTYDAQVIPVLTKIQLLDFDKTRPFAVFSAHIDGVGVHASHIPAGSNLAYVFYHDSSRTLTIELDQYLQDDIDKYKAVNPEVIISVGTSKDALAGKGLRPRLASSLYGYGETDKGSPTLRPVKEIHTKILMQDASTSAGQEEPAYRYVISIGTASGLNANVKIVSKDNPEAYITSVAGSSLLCTSLVESNVQLEVGNELQLVGLSAWRASNGMYHEHRALVADMMVGDPDVHGSVHGG